jgi:proton-coupled amino acid transporter
MSSPLPVNAKQGYREGGSSSSYDYNGSSPLSSSFDRAHSTARLGSSPGATGLYGSSPTKSVLSQHTTYGSVVDLDNVLTNTSLFRPLTTATFNPEDNTVSVDLLDNQVVQVVKRHLVDTSPSPSLLSRTTSNVGGDQASTSNFTSVHQLPGGAITHDIYKWAEDNDNEQSAKRQRSQSFFVPKSEPLDSALARLKDPGGFRRHFVVDKAARQGRKPPHWMTRTFVDFLAL